MNKTPTITKWRPLSLTADLTRAVLDGRKTVTRRPVKIERFPCVDWTYVSVAPHRTHDLAPLGNPGDGLYVREPAKCITRLLTVDGVQIEYRADDARRWLDWPDHLKPPREGCGLANGCPKAAARLFLRIDEVRVERLRDITETSARAEGIATDVELGESTHGAAFARAWDRIYSPKGLGWSDNPWVWVYSFTRVERPERWANPKGAV